jgi:hypothetical protein
VLLRGALTEGGTYPMLHGDADPAPAPDRRAFPAVVRPKR